MECKLPSALKTNVKIFSVCDSLLNLLGFVSQFSSPFLTMCWECRSTSLSKSTNNLIKLDATYCLGSVKSILLWMREMVSEQRGFWGTPACYLLMKYSMFRNINQLQFCTLFVPFCFPFYLIPIYILPFHEYYSFTSPLMCFLVSCIF